MKRRTTLMTVVFAIAGLPLMAQQSPPYGRSGAAQSQAPGNNQSSPPNYPPEHTPPASEVSTAKASTDPAPMAAMDPVNGELVGKLDSKTANVGDNVVVQTKQPVKTSDGTEIPKGSKLVGKVLGVQHSTGGDNSQLAVAFDHVELKSGQSLPVHSQIQSIGSASGSDSSAGTPDMSGPARSATSPDQSGSNAAAGNRGSVPDSSRAPTGDAPTAGGPTPGTLVSRTGNIAIRTTSIPGVLVANNVPGAQDPRMGQASSILLGAKQDIKLEGGTQIIVGISAANKGPQ